MDLNAITSVLRIAEEDLIQTEEETTHTQR